MCIFFCLYDFVYQYFYDEDDVFVCFVCTLCENVRYTLIEHVNL